MRQYEVFRTRPLRHGPQIRRGALAIVSIRKHAAAFARPHDGVDRRMHDDVGSLRDSLHLIGGRRAVAQNVVSGVAADDDAAAGVSARYETCPAICVERMALTFTSPADQTTWGSSVGSKVGY